MPPCPIQCDPRRCQTIKRIGENFFGLIDVLEREEVDINQKIEEIIIQIAEELIELQTSPGVGETPTPVDRQNAILSRSRRLTSMSIEGSKILTRMLTISVETNVDTVSSEGARNMSTDMLRTIEETGVIPDSMETETSVADSVTTIRSHRTEDLIQPLTKLLRQMLIG